MYKIDQICDYVILKTKIDENQNLNHLKLQKLLYYIKGWYYAIKDEKLFNDRFQAWVHGPVNRTIYDRFKDSKYLYSEILQKDIIDKNISQQIDSETKGIIDEVLEVYMPYSGAQLENMTHSAEPWSDARKGYNDTDNCEEFIKEELIIKHFKQKINVQ